MKETIVTSLNLQTLGALNTIWTSKNWALNSTVELDKAFITFSELLSECNADEQILLLELTRAYSRFTFSDYHSLIVKAFLKITANHLQDIEQVILAPLINPSDDSRRDVKSGHLMLYPAEHIGIPANMIFEGIPINALSTADAIVGNLGNKNTLVILLDDFIGSGDTAINGINSSIENMRENDKLIIVTLVAMQHAVQRLTSRFGIEVICAETLLKGIEQNANIADKLHAYRILDGIEQKISITRDYRRGYQKSESLVSMIRTPDNTFPMYWCNRRDGGGIWPAPFPRK